MVPDNDAAFAAPPTTPLDDALPASHSVAKPVTQTTPLVLASPHSGRDYPADFVATAQLSPLTLRRSEDAFIDQVFADAPAHGAPLLRAHFPRVYLDPNREPYELDPAMFADPLPPFANARSPRVAAGLGTVARVVASGERIYGDRKLRVVEALSRVDRHYFPYHRTLRALLLESRQRFGGYLLIDCHSMPSVGGPMDADPGLHRVDFVLGDCFGTSCSREITEFVEARLIELGYSARRNIPYAGGFTTRHYGRPEVGGHALQIEINRALYLDERRIEPTAGFEAVATAAGRLIAALAPAALRLIRAR